MNITPITNLQIKVIPYKGVIDFAIPEKEILGIGEQDEIKVDRELKYYKTNLEKLTLEEQRTIKRVRSKIKGYSNLVMAINRNGTYIYKWPKENFLPFSLLDYIPSLKHLVKGESFAPFTLDLDCNDSCLDDCPFCFSKEFRKKRIKPNNEYSQISNFDSKQTLKSFREIGTHHVRFVCSGEPLEHPDINEILKYSKDLGFTISLFTNGNNLTNEKIQKTVSENVDLLRLSLDSGNEKERRKMHRPSKPVGYDSIIHSLNAIRQLNIEKENNLTIGIHYILHKFNYRGIEKLNKEEIFMPTDYFFFGHAFGCVGEEFSSLEDEERKKVQTSLKELTMNAGPEKYIHINLPLKRAVFSEHYQGRSWQRDGNPKKWDNCYTFYNMPIIEPSLDMVGCSLLRGNLHPNVPTINSKSNQEEPLANQFLKFSSSVKKHNLYDICSDCCSYPLNAAFDNTYRLIKEDQNTKFYLLYYQPYKNNNLPPDYSLLPIINLKDRKQNQ